MTELEVEAKGRAEEEEVENRHVRGPIPSAFHIGWDAIRNRTAVQTKAMRKRRPINEGQSWTRIRNTDCRAAKLGNGSDARNWNMLMWERG